MKTKNALLLALAGFFSHSLAQAAGLESAAVSIAKARFAKPLLSGEARILSEREFYCNSVDSVPGNPAIESVVELKFEYEDILESYTAILNGSDRYELEAFQSGRTFVAKCTGEVCENRISFRPNAGGEIYTELAVPRAVALVKFGNVEFLSSDVDPNFVAVAYGQCVFKEKVKKDLTVETSGWSSFFKPITTQRVEYAVIDLTQDEEDGDEISAQSGSESPEQELERFKKQARAGFKASLDYLHELNTVGESHVDVKNLRDLRNYYQTHFEELSAAGRLRLGNMLELGIGGPVQTKEAAAVATGSSLRIGVQGSSAKGVKRARAGAQSFESTLSSDPRIALGQLIEYKYPALTPLARLGGGESLDASIAKLLEELRGKFGEAVIMLGVGSSSTPIGVLAAMTLDQALIDLVMSVEESESLSWLGNFLDSEKNTLLHITYSRLIGLSLGHPEAEKIRENAGKFSKFLFASGKNVSIPIFGENAKGETPFSLFCKTGLIPDYDEVVTAANYSLAVSFRVRTNMSGTMPTVRRPESEDTTNAVSARKRLKDSIGSRSPTQAEEKLLADFNDFISRLGGPS